MTRIRHREKLSGASVAPWRGSCKTNDRHDRKIRGQKNTCRPAICRVGQRRSKIHFSVPFIFLSVSVFSSRLSVPSVLSVVRYFWMHFELHFGTGKTFAGREETN